MPNKSFVKRLVERRIPHILGSYLVAGTSLILFIEYLVEKYQFPSHYPTLSLFALIGILPSVIILSYFHGAPGKDEWTKVEKVGIPVNVLFIASILFFGDSINIWNIEEGYEEQSNVKDTFLINMHSSKQIDNWMLSIKDKTEYSDFPELEILSDSLLDEIKTYVTTFLESKYLNLDVDLHYPNKELQQTLDIFPPYEMIEEGVVDEVILENKMLEIYDDYENKGIYLDGIINVVFVRISPKDEKKWGRYFFYNFYELQDGEEFNAWWFSSPNVDWENDTDIEIKKEAASYLYNQIYELRFGDNYIGEVVEILDDNLLKIFLSKTNIHKNVKVELMKYYSAGRAGRDEWIADLNYIDTFIAENKILKDKYIEILNKNSSLLDTLINNYSIIIKEDSLLLSGGGSNYWKDGMNDYYGKVLSITNDEAIVKVLKQEYPFGRIRVGDEVYIYDDY